ncbi:uncharacterized protein LOC133829822 [Humulus lupulus]|uniref:uncharacterized protein LOC133829822 n=1 Tax=Humulus lupulus TaxID=3486 RepID=UPI002B4143CB|nr:uncharacterized protein LOC133829822 [Humulus lupulus]
MAGILLISNPTSLVLTLSTHSSNPSALRPTHTPTTASFNSSRLPNSPALTFSGDPLKTRARARGTSVVTRAGPSTGSFVLAFFLPLSLILVTVFASIRISDKLDRDYLEEVALNEAIRQSEEDEGEDDIELPSDNNVTPPRTRNRPIREV